MILILLVAQFLVLMAMAAAESFRRRPSWLRTVFAMLATQFSAASCALSMWSGSWFGIIGALGWGAANAWLLAALIHFIPSDHDEAVSE